MREKERKYQAEPGDWLDMWGKVYHPPQQGKQPVISKREPLNPVEEIRILKQEMKGMREEAREFRVSLIRTFKNFTDEVEKRLLNNLTYKEWIDHKDEIIKFIGCTEEKISEIIRRLEENDASI